MPAGTIQTLYTVALPTSDFPPSSPLGNVTVFAQKVSGQSACHIDSAGIGLQDNQYRVAITLKNETNDAVSYDGLTDVMIVNMN